MVSTLEDLSVELFYEIFSCFQLHEICNMFWNVNSRMSSIIENLPSLSVYLGRCGMNIEVTNFYYEYLSQPNICTRLTSLCVSDTVSIGNGLWFAKHGSTFINLRYLSLIDINRSSFEMILDSLSPIYSLIMFSVHFVSADYRAACTFVRVPEGAYHERIFRLFPSLRVCQLLFDRKERHAIQTLLSTTPNRSIVPIQINLSNLRSLTLRYCLPEFLPHLFEHLPQLQQLSCHLYNMSVWAFQQHSPEHDYDNQYMPVNKRLAPNLLRLKMNWVEEINLKSIEMLFDDDVLFSLTNFTLLAKITGVYVLHNVLSKLSIQCSYRIDVTWNVLDDQMSLPGTINVLSNTFERLKEPIPIELDLSSERGKVWMRAITIPRTDSCFSLSLFQNAMHNQWTNSKHLLGSRWFHCNEIKINSQYDQMIDEYLSLASNIICWDRITSISIYQPLKSCHIRVLFSQMINLCILTLIYIFDCGNLYRFNDKSLIDLINDESLCNILTSNGLRQLNLSTQSGQSNLISLSHRIIKRLPYLEVIEMNGCLQQVELIKMASILINGLSKLSFVALSGSDEIHSIYKNDITLFNFNTRSFRMEMSNGSLNGKTLLIWL